MKLRIFAAFKNKQTTLEILKSIAVGLASNAVDFFFNPVFI